MGRIVEKNDNGGEGELDDLVRMIDRLIEQGDGHLTIDVDDTADGIRINRFSTTDCGKVGACAQPNEPEEEGPAD
ncbi:MAG: hypothetical protein IKO44_02740 [Ruminococcus sp.]|nr:hypothetical protein [Ruminococcus sp.]